MAKKKVPKLEVPDKGHAWVVAFAACIINMILSGLSRMIGVLYVAVLDAYGTSRAEATVPFTTRNAVRMLSGPLVGIIGQRFGIRTVTFWGGVVASAGAALCCIAPNMTWLAIFWGGMHGLGFAFANTLFQVVVNQYFEKHRATASGIALSGACVGSLGFPFMIETILGEFGLSGGFLILGGVVMHVLPPSLLLTVPQWVQHPEAYARLWAIQNADQSAEPASAVVVEKESSEPPLSQPPESEFQDCGFRLQRSTSLDNCPVENLDVCLTTREMGGSEPAVRFEEKRSSDSSMENVVCTLYTIRESPSSSDRRSSEQNGKVAKLRWSPNSNSTHHEQDAAKTPITEPPNQEEEVKEEKDTKSNTLKFNNNQSFAQILRNTFNLYKNPLYVLICLCMSTYVLIFIPILTVIVDYGLDKGIPESSGKYLINAMAIGDLAGRLCFGWITDKKYMSIPSFISLVLVLEGAFIALFPYAMSLAAFVTLLVLYGMMAGAILVLFPVLVLQYVDINSQSVGMANVGFMSGVVSFAIPPMIGHFRDEVGSYDGMFYLTGVLSVLSGGMWLLEPVVARYMDRKETTSKENVEAVDGGKIRNDIQISVVRKEESKPS